MDGHEIVKKVRTFFSSSNQLVFGNEMAGKLSAMRERFNDIASDRNNFQLIERPLETRAVSRERETHSFVRDKEVIGREEDKKAIIGLLQDSDVKENVSFISIVGIGGLGKTTLAQYVYNDRIVKAHFELKIWVCVSDVFDVKTIVENIIISATRKKPESLIMEHLQTELREILNQKMYLLVLDDVWNENEETWGKLRTLLLDGKRGSKVVITTRTKLVAHITSPMSQYSLKGLSEDQSWSLLKQMAFEEGQETINTNFKAIGMDIVKKCKGVPLAIKIIGRVLNHKKTVAEWSYIKNIELTKVPKLKDGIMPVLKLSYNHLPPHLKCCFAYCSLFPKDYLIDKLKLIQLWIAQGFIQSPDEDLLLVDVADDYFKELLWRSFFQEAEEDGGKNRRFKMHDLIHDLAEYVSETDCTLVDSNAKNVKEKGHHLSFPFYNVSFFEENLSKLVKANKIRTFILVYNNWAYNQGRIEESTLEKLISSFRFLRALDLHGLNMKMLPDTIGTLMCLKYLDLSFNNIKDLPSSITKLVTLQTLKLCKCKMLRELPVGIQKLVSLMHLDLKGCKSLTRMPLGFGQLTSLQVLKLSYCKKLSELPSDIQKLVSLKHLYINGCENLTHMPCGLGQLTSLQALNLFVVSKGSSKHCGGLAELNKLNDLRGKLEIKNLAWVKDASSEFKAANLKEKQHLSELELIWNLEGDYAVDTCDDENSMDGLQPHQSLKSLIMYGYMGVRVSSWLSFLTNLVDLYISDCKKCQYLPPLYQLPTLRVLQILDMDGLEYMTEGDMNDEISASLASPSTFFPSLEYLRISACLNLKGWWRSVDKGNEATTTSTISSSSSSSSTNHIPLPYFPRLSSLWLENCPKMTCMPLFPNLERTLHLWDGSWKALEETIEMNNRGGRASSFPSSSSSSSSSFSPPLSKLKTLHLTLKLESLPEEWFKNLTSLETLRIWECPNLTSLPEGMSHLTSLQRLSIQGCPKLKQRCEKENGEDWDKISHIPNLTISDGMFGMF
ncbi:disease resistance protein RGA2-like isoform X2 [Quercus robur]|uniref:disease resistance protein RGA2-like isoform X2 n=1 Tax=Quercus robur TaxID=38942 RepID=UPI002163A1A5|nr:disease resistance protein RGA2-like isoform X2 [Quercus robur]